MADITQIYEVQIRTLDDVLGLARESKERIVELYEQILDEVVADSTLADLNSTSNVAIWRLWSFIIAINIWLHEFNWTRYRVHLEDAVRFAQSHNRFWYQQRAKEYQHGDSVTVVNGVVKYDPIVPANRIIAAASVTENGGNLTIKVAKEVSGNLTALSGPELTGFGDYVNAFQDAGVVINLVSQNADVLKFTGEIYYDSSKTSLGTFQAALETAINGYVQGLDFQGQFRRIHLIDAMQSVNGFVDVKFDSLAASVSYTSTPLFVNIDLVYDTIAGYMNVDANYPLSSGLTYIAV